MIFVNDCQGSRIMRIIGTVIAFIKDVVDNHDWMAVVV
jgi:hypothetical protein